MNQHSDDKVVFGFWVYLMSDVVLFASLFATYAVLQGAIAGGPSGAELFSLPLVLAQTLILLTSSFTIGLALVAAPAKRSRWVLVLLTTTLLLGLAFLAMELVEFSTLIAEGAGPDRSAFLSSFFALVGTHGLHVAAGCLWLLGIMAHVVWRPSTSLRTGGLSESTLRKLACFALFWHFLDLIWIFIFSFVYLFGLI